MVKNKIRICFCLLFAVFMVLIMATNSMAQSWIEEREISFRDGNTLYVDIPIQTRDRPSWAPNDFTQRFEMNIDNMWDVDIYWVGVEPWNGKYWRLMGWLNAPNVYCMQRGKDITSYSDTKLLPGAFFHFSMEDSYGENYYTEGHTFATGNHVSNYIDGQWLAYLHSCSPTTSKGFEEYSYHDNDQQNIIWGTYKEQMDKAQRAGIVAETGTIDSKEPVHDISNMKHYRESNAYLSYKQTWANTPIQSNYRNITVNAGDQYTLVGPLNVTYPSGEFEGKLFGGLMEGKGSKIKLYDKSGNEISSNYWDLVDIWGNVISIPSSNNDFYIRFSTNAISQANINNVGRLTFTMRDMKAEAEWYRFYNPNYADRFQHIIILLSAKKYYEESPLEVPINVDIELKGNLQITKVDQANGKTLGGVGFKVYNQDRGQYVINTNPITYGDYNQSSTFYTDSYGNIWIGGLWKGNYQVVETSIGNNYGYVVDSTPHYVTVPSNNTGYVTVDNKYKLGNLQIIKQDQTSKKPLKGVGFKILYKDNGQYITGTNPVTYGNVNQARTYYTDSSGKITVYGLWEGSYQVIETTIGDNYGYVVDSTPHNITVTANKTNPITITNRYRMGNLQIIKQDQDNKRPLKGVGFKIYNRDNGKYIVSTDPVVYGNVNQAKVYLTDSNGKITIQRLWEGNYQAIETTIGSNPGYVVDPTPHQFTITAEKTATTTIYNRKVYVNLNGYVWVDKQYDVGKETIRNDLYKDNVYDKNDQLKSGVPVVLKEYATGKVIKTTTTNSSGKYTFKDVLIDELSKYTVEFTYDGLIYQNVNKTLNKANGSKAVETTRQNFNNNFASVQAGSKESQAAVKNSNNSTVATVDYNFKQQTSGRVASIASTKGLDITANTKSAGYTLSYDRQEISIEIENINLGIYERRQADLALQNELEEVKVEIAGYGHIYKYGASYDASNSQQAQNSWNLGIRFESPYKEIYKRPVYRADAEYETDDNSNMLKMALTYKITIANQEDLNTKVNKIVDYYDSRYTLVGIGTGVNEQGSLTGKFATNRYRSQTSNVSGYSKVEIDLNQLIGASSEDTTLDKKTQYSIYIQFDLSRENIIEMLNENVYEDDPQLNSKLNSLETRGKNLKNTAEITSFTTYSDSQGKTLYAAVDKDSIPGNATVGNYQTYEDDTDKASSLAIILANARSVSGTIFEDSEIKQLSEQSNISEGDATFDPNTENAIGGVKAELIDAETEQVVEVYDEQNKEWTGAEANAVSSSDGTYTISGFIPGEYKIKFTWGDGSYKIVDGRDTPTEEDYYTSMPENYKSTVMDPEKYERIYESEEGKKFYREANESDTHTSYAIDNIDTRKAIDNEFKDYTYDASTDIRQMTSITPTMEINVEYSDDDYLSISYERVANRIAFNINNVDFGIIKRPTQKVNFVKALSDIRITLANGQIIIDAHIDSDGNLSGQTNYLAYTPPIKEDGITVENGFLRIEMDASLLQGSTVDMKYRLTTENTSQADYVDDAYGYYIYGESYYSDVLNDESRKEDDVLTVSPTKVVDYLDENSIFLPEDATNKEYLWRQMSIQELKDEGLVASNVTEALQDGRYNVTNADGEVEQVEELDEKQIFTTDYFFVNGIKFKPKFIVNNTVHNPEGGDLYIVVSKVINSEDDANFQNQAEIIQAEKGGGKPPEWTPGNYIPNGVNQELDDSTSEETAIIPSTGLNKAYILPITVLVVSFVLLGIGIYLIIVKVMKRDFR